jgi:hypothetical protein
LEEQLLGLVELESLPDATQVRYFSTKYLAYR